MIIINYNRRSIRLKHFDYSKNELYFITICTKDRDTILTEICRGRVPPLPTKNISYIQKITPIGSIIENSIKNINNIFPAKIFEYVIMPDHIHFIIQLNNQEGMDGTLPLHAIIGRFKSFTTRKYNLLNNTNCLKLWQRNYFEHIIRNEKEYLTICEYMINNPLKYVL